MSDNKVLSQEEIDALLNASPPAAAETGPAPAAATAPAAPAPDSIVVQTVKVFPAPPLNVKAPPAVPAGLDLSALQAKPSAGAPAGTASPDSLKAIQALEARVARLEKSLQKQEALEKRADALTEAIRKLAGSMPKGLEQKIALMWQGLQNTPDYNLYEKFVCKKCATAGAAQMKARCSKCGNEGWFGRKPPA
jgi:hypothetical protein